MKPVRTAARGLLGGIFIASGARAVANPEQLVPQAKRVTDRIAPVLEKTDPRLPTEPRTLIRINGVVQLIGGLLLATGQGVRPAAGALAVSLVPTTVAGHPFWAVDDPVQRRTHEVHFLKNLGLLGGLLLAVADTQGRPGLRWRAGRFAGDTRRSMKRAARRSRRRARLGQNPAPAALVLKNWGRAHLRQNPAPAALAGGARRRAHTAAREARLVWRASRAGFTVGRRTPR